MAYKIKDGKLYWEKWFEKNNGEYATKHRNAYNKSIKEQKCVKVSKGSYYYKGIEINNYGGTEYPWNWKKPTIFNGVCAKTKRECIETIDYMIKNKYLDLYDIVCV